MKLKKIIKVPITPTEKFNELVKEYREYSNYHSIYDNVSTNFNHCRSCLLIRCNSEISSGGDVKFWREIKRMSRKLKY